MIKRPVINQCFDVQTKGIPGTHTNTLRIHECHILVCMSLQLQLQHSIHTCMYSLPYLGDVLPSTCPSFALPLATLLSLVQHRNTTLLRRRWCFPHRCSLKYCPLPCRSPTSTPTRSTTNRTYHRPQKNATPRASVGKTAVTCATSGIDCCRSTNILLPRQKNQTNNETIVVLVV